MSISPDFLPPMAEEDSVHGILQLIDNKVGGLEPQPDGRRWGEFTSTDQTGQRLWLGLQQVPAQSSECGEVALVHAAPLEGGRLQPDNTTLYYFLAGGSGDVSVQEHHPLATEDDVYHFPPDDAMNVDTSISDWLERMASKRRQTLRAEREAGLGVFYQSDARALEQLIRKAKPYRYQRFPWLRGLAGR